MQFQDFYNENQLLQVAGLGFGEEESQRIAMSLRRLADETKATSIRFWGKILCSKKDYYVAEGVTSNDNADQLTKDAEKKGEGANTYTFWVTQDGNYPILSNTHSLELHLHSTLQIHIRIIVHL